MCQEFNLLIFNKMVMIKRHQKGRTNGAIFFTILMRGSIIAPVLSK